MTRIYHGALILVGTAIAFATSVDGNSLTKREDPSTGEAPCEESDPGLEPIAAKVSIRVGRLRVVLSPDDWVAI